jgi:hypothetical protein
MANALYPKFKEALLNQAAGTAAINLSSDTSIKVALVNISGSTNAYTYSSSHQYFSSVSTNSAAVVGTSGALGNKTVTNGVFDADDVTVTGVSGTNVIGALVIYKDTNTAASSPLIAFLDSGTGLSITPNGGSVTVSWDSGANRIFAL